MDRKEWERLERSLTKGYKWERQEVKRRNKKGRPMGGMIVGIKEERGRIEMIKVEERGEGVMMVEVQVGEERWRIVGVYVNGDMEEKMEKLREWLEDQREDSLTIIGGGFNARIGSLGGGKWKEEEEEERRK